MKMTVCKLSHSWWEVRDNWVTLGWKPWSQAATIAPLSASLSQLLFLSPCNTQAPSSRYFCFSLPELARNIFLTDSAKIKNTRDETSSQLPALHEKSLQVLCEDGNTLSVLHCCSATFKQSVHLHRSFCCVHPSFPPHFIPFPIHPKTTHTTCMLCLSQGRFVP